MRYLLIMLICSCVSTGHLKCIDSPKPTKACILAQDAVDCASAEKNEAFTLLVSALGGQSKDQILDQLKDASLTLGGCVIADLIKGHPTSQPSTSMRSDLMAAYLKEHQIEGAKFKVGSEVIQ